jgi:GGDEF domain-containing protein
MSSEDEKLFGKKALVEISHAIERFALAAEPGSPLVVIAMFQKLSYFAREVDVYREIAARRAITLVGLAEDYPPELPPGVRHTLLDAAHPLAREWSVTVLGREGGATLVAVDQESLDPNAHTIEEGRRFSGKWSFRRADAYAQVVRLRSQLRMSADSAAQIDAVLRDVLEHPEPFRQDWWEVPLRFLGDRMDGMIRERGAAVADLEALRDNTTERDPRTGLYTAAFLERWTRGLGSGTLPIGLVLLRVFGAAQLRAQYGLRAELTVLQGLRESIGALLRATDRMIRLGREDFLLVLPSWANQDVLRLADEVCLRVSALDQLYPFVALPAAAAATVTRERPLPVQRLMHEVQSEPRVAVSA